MNRTIAELAAHGNPFKETGEAARLLMPRRSSEFLRCWISTEAPGLGAINVGALATYGLVVSRRSVRSWGAITSAVERWLFPSNDAMPGQVGRLDIERTALGSSGTTRTTALFMSPALDEGAGWQTGVRLEVTQGRGGQCEAKVDLVETTSVAQAGFTPVRHMLNRDTYGQETVRALEGDHVPDLPYPSAAHAVLPLVTNCNRVLTELAAGTESVSWIQLPIAARATQ